LTGQVLDGRDRAVEGARVSANVGGQRVETVTDAAGAFALAATDYTSMFEATKDGYEQSWHPVDLSNAEPGGRVLKNLRLHEILRVRAGDTVEVWIKPDDPLCSSESDPLESYPCRTVRVVASVTGLLRVGTPE